MCVELRSFVEFLMANLTFVVLDLKMDAGNIFYLFSPLKLNEFKTYRSM